RTLARNASGDDPTLRTAPHRRPPHHPRGRLRRSFGPLPRAAPIPDLGRAPQHRRLSYADRHLLRRLPTERPATMPRVPGTFIAHLLCEPLSGDGTDFVFTPGRLQRHLAGIGQSLRIAARRDPALALEDDSADLLAVPAAREGHFDRGVAGRSLATHPQPCVARRRCAPERNR